MLTIGLINNMPDSALQATERQFMRLLTAAAGNNRINFHCFSLPSVHRSQPAKCVSTRQYSDIADLGRLQIDGLIVTGAEPNAATLPEEPFWQELTDDHRLGGSEHVFNDLVVSCRTCRGPAFDGIERQRLNAKCSGVYDCSKVTDDWLTADVPSSLKVAHSRINELRASDLTAHGYQLLTESRDAGVDIFAKQLRSHFIFFQGHPEYDALSLQREYLRDITRFLSGERDTYPAIPAGYFEAETEARLASFQMRAAVERKLPLSTELPGLKVRPDIAAGATAITIFKNWLEYLSESAKPALPSVYGRTQR